MSTAGQTRRLIAIDTSLGPDQLMLLRYSGSESLSAPFSFELELLSEQEISFEDIVGKPATISVALADGERFINGSDQPFRTDRRTVDLLPLLRTACSLVLAINTASRLPHLPEQVDPRNH